MRSATTIIAALLCASCTGGPVENGRAPSRDEAAAMTRPGASATPRSSGDTAAPPRAPIGEDDAGVETALEMLPVPGGSFEMGSDDGLADPDERPGHEVTVRSFLLDRTEVTNAAYAECVAACACRKPADKETEKAGFAPLDVFRASNRPVTAVSQRDAAAYCAWRGKRLPTEAEFERAARGDDGRWFAWGDREPDSDLAVYDRRVTAPVGSKPAGAGPYGHLDLAGNVWEWTSDLYDPLAYRRPGAADGVPADCPEILRTQDRLRAEGKEGFTGTNPIPTECEYVLRGGAFNYFAKGLRASNRVHHPSSWRMIMAGLRCAKDAGPTP